MSFKEKLKKIEKEKLQLVEKRLFEIAKLADRTKVLGLDNNILAGTFLYALEASQAEDKKTLDDLISRAKKMPSRATNLRTKTKSTLSKNKATNTKTDNS